MFANIISLASSAIVTKPKSGAPDTTNPVAGTLTATQASSNQINISLSGQSDNVGIDHIILSWSPNGTDAWTELSATWDGSTYNHTSLTASTQYFYRAVVYDAAGNNATATDNATTAAASSFTHYVSNTGSDTWANATSISTPCSYQTAMANVSAGDVVAFRGGIYTIDFTGASYELPAVRPANSGTSENPITLVAYTGETPVFNGNPADPSMAVFGVRDQAYIIWDGFSGTMANEVNTAWLCVLIGSTVGSTHDCIVRNCNLQGSGVNTTGNNSAPIRMDLTLNCEVYNNTLHENQGAASGINSCGIWLFTVQSCTIRNNNIYNCENGIMQKNPNNETCQIYHNFIHDIGTNAMNFNEQNPTATVGGHLVHDNLLLNIGSYGIFFGDSYEIPNYSMYNNTLVNVGIGFGTHGTAGWRDAVLYNNIVYNHSGAYVQVYATDLPATLNYNCYYDPTSDVWYEAFNTPHTTLASWQTFTSLEANSFTGNPTFTVGTGTAPTNYTLDAGSNCIGTGLGGVNVGALDLSQVGVQ